LYFIAGTRGGKDIENWGRGLKQSGVKRPKKFCSCPPLIQFALPPLIGAYDLFALPQLRPNSKIC